MLTVLLVLVVVVSPASAIVGGKPDFAHTNVGAIVLQWPEWEQVVLPLAASLLAPPFRARGHIFLPENNVHPARGKLYDHSGISSRLFSFLPMVSMRHLNQCRNRRLYLIAP